MAPKALQMVPVDVTKFRRFVLVDIHPDLQTYEEGEKLDVPIHKTTGDGLLAWKSHSLSRSSPRRDGQRHRST